MGVSGVYSPEDLRQGEDAFTREIPLNTRFDDARAGLSSLGHRVELGDDDPDPRGRGTIAELYDGEEAAGQRGDLPWSATCSLKVQGVEHYSSALDILDHLGGIRHCPNRLIGDGLEAGPNTVCGGIGAQRGE